MMTMSPKAMMQLRSLFSRFQKNHPKVPQFLQAAAKRIDEGSVIEVKLTTADGTELCTNMRVTADDLELVKVLQGQAKGETK